MKKILLIFMAVIACLTASANTKFITDIVLIGGTYDEMQVKIATLVNNGWKLINSNLNDGVGGDYIYLLYKSDYVNSGYITDFYLSNKKGTVPESITFNNRNYTLAPCEGGTHFGQVQGNLNSNVSSSDDIHLYFTRDGFDDNRAVTEIYFDNVQNGAVGKNGGTTGYNLNAGAGSSSSAIYMHLNTSNPGWVAEYNVTNTECYLIGYNGYVNDITTLNIPYSVNGATVIGIDMNFADFTNLVTMNFPIESKVDLMPSVQGCQNFKHINLINTSGNIYRENQLPDNMTGFQASALAGTAIEELRMPNVTDVTWSYTGVFEGCNNLSLAVFSKAATIGPNSFANIHSDNCRIGYNGSINNWDDYRTYHHSPNLIIGASDYSWYRGWCGNYDANNCVVWKLESNGQLNIYCDTELFYEDNPSSQIISTHPWVECRDHIFVRSVTIDHVYAIGQREFENRGVLANVYINPTLHSIGKEAFYGCNALTDLWFDGNQAQWDAVSKDSQWRNGANNLKAHWHCTVTFNANGHGTAPAAQDIQWSNRDKATEPTAPTASGFDFKGWFTDAACTNRWYFNDEVPGDMTLYAKWEASQYAINVSDAIEHGTVTADKQTATAGETVTLTVTPDYGYEFGTLTVMNGSTAVATTPGTEEGKYTFVMPGAPVNVTATFFMTPVFPVSSTEVTAGNITFKMIKVEGNDNISTFYIGECEVTEALWMEVMGGNNPSSHGGNLGDNLPVETITWNDCQAFITKLNEMTHLQFRLPTAQEWLFAAAGGNNSQGYTYSGSNTINNVAWYHDNCSSKQTVGTKMPNELGIYDMSGNVYEIIQEATGVYGGGWHAPASRCTVGYYWGANETFADDDTGFRLAITNFDSTSVPGDVNGDGEVTTIDITAIYNYLLNGDTTYLATSDVDGDGFVTTVDITAIYNILLGNKK